MKHLKSTSSLTLAAIFASLTSYASDGFYGMIDSRPEEDVGVWIIDGKKIEVTDETELIEENGPLDIDACVEVEFDGSLVAKIESQKPNKCRK